MQINVWIPGHFEQAFSYAVPKEWEQDVVFGCRVIVPFRTKICFGICAGILEEKLQFEVKNIIEIPDGEAIISKNQFEFWQWIASYYQVSFGLVLDYALPKAFALKADTLLYPNPEFSGESIQISDNELLILDALDIQKSLKISELKAILPDIKKPLAFAQSMFKKNMLKLENEFKQRYLEKKIKFAQLIVDKANFSEQELKLYKRSPKQQELVDFLSQQQEQKASFVELFKNNTFSKVSLKSLITKQWVEITEKQVNRKVFFAELKRQFSEPKATKESEFGLNQIQTAFENKRNVLIIESDTNSKLFIFKELIKNQLENKKDVLFLISDQLLYPQFYSFFKQYFEQELLVYHKQLNENEKVEVWKHIYNHELRSSKLIVATKEGIFLPINNLGLTIIDEEADINYKNIHNPPFFHARDMAKVWQQFSGFNLLLSTVSPSLESWQMAQNQKLELVDLRQKEDSRQRFQIIDLQKSMEDQEMIQHFSKTLIQQIDQVLSQGKQVLIYKDRRGYASRMTCKSCDFTPQCVHCSVNLTFHKADKRLRCHRCSYQRRLTYYCDECGKPDMAQKGYGTERLLEELRSIFTKHQVVRLDKDQVNSKSKLADFIDRFDSGEIDILIGTRLITKGLDLRNTSLLAVVLADDLFFYPDFRVEEQAVQNLTQVSSRVQVQNPNANILIQTYRSSHPAIKALVEGSQLDYFDNLLEDRASYLLPPYTRMILIIIKHKKKEKVEEAGKFLFEQLIQKIDKNRVYPAYSPSIHRLRSYNIQHIQIQLLRNDRLKAAKLYIAESIQTTSRAEQFKGLRVSLDVDPIFV
ncbi:MAG: replication restart helicase PriA [Flavobacteriales bacterium]